MKEFFQYIFCSLSGRSLQYSYAIEPVNWANVQDNFRYFTTQLTIDDNVMVSVAEEEIVILEFYDSGIVNRGSSMPINNEAETTIRYSGRGVTVTVELRRAGESIFFTNIVVILWLVLSLLFIILLFSWLAGSKVFNALPLLIPIGVLTLIIVIMWTITRGKYKRVRAGIKAIIED